MGTASYLAAFAAWMWLKTGIIAVCSSRSWSVALPNRLCCRSVSRGIPQLLHQSTKTVEWSKSTGSPVNSSLSTQTSHTRCARRGPQVSEALGPRSVCSTATLMECWGKQGARTDHQACVSSTAGRDFAAVSCITHKELKVVRCRAARSAGWLFASTSDGFVVHLAEFVGTESLGRRYFFLADLLGAAPEIDIVIHDDACHLRKYAASRASKSSSARRLGYPRVKYVIDRSHSKGHVDHWCKQHCMHTLPENEKSLQGVNTSVCKQQFSKLGRYKFMVLLMGAAIGAFLLHEVVALRNKERVRYDPSKCCLWRGRQPARHRRRGAWDVAIRAAGTSRHWSGCRFGEWASAWAGCSFPGSCSHGAVRRPIWDIWVLDCLSRDASGVGNARVTVHVLHAHAWSCLIRWVRWANQASRAHRPPHSLCARGADAQEQKLQDGTKECHNK